MPSGRSCGLMRACDESVTCDTTLADYSGIHLAHVLAYDAGDPVFCVYKFPSYIGNDAAFCNAVATLCENGGIDIACIKHCAIIF